MPLTAEQIKAARDALDAKKLAGVLIQAAEKRRSDEKVAENKLTPAHRLDHQDRRRSLLIYEVIIQLQSCFTAEDKSLNDIIEQDILLLFHAIQNTPNFIFYTKHVLAELTKQKIEVQGEEKSATLLSKNVKHDYILEKLNAQSLSATQINRVVARIKRIICLEDKREEAQRMKDKDTENLQHLDKFILQDTITIVGILLEERFLRMLELPNTSAARDAQMEIFYRLLEFYSRIVNFEAQQAVKHFFKVEMSFAEVSMIKEDSVYWQLTKRMQVVAGLHKDEKNIKSKSPIEQTQVSDIVGALCNHLLLAVQNNRSIPEALSALLFCAIAANAIQFMKEKEKVECMFHDSLLTEYAYALPMFFYRKIILYLPPGIIASQEEWRDRLATGLISQALDFVVERFLNQGVLQYVDLASRTAAVKEIGKELIARAGDKTKLAQQHAVELFDSITAKFLHLTYLARITSLNGQADFSRKFFPVPRYAAVIKIVRDNGVGKSLETRMEPQTKAADAKANANPLAMQPAPSAPPPAQSAAASPQALPAKALIATGISGVTSPAKQMQNGQDTTSPFTATAPALTLDAA